MTTLSELVADISATPDDELLHYGKKGMKWGVTNTKPTSADIQNARIRVSSQQRELGRQVDKLNATSASGGKQADRDAQKLVQMQNDFLRNPDRATALRMTKGEKFAHVVVGLAVPGVGTAAAAVSATATVAGRKAVERQLAELNG